MRIIVLFFFTILISNINLLAQNYFIEKEALVYSIKGAFYDGKSVRDDAGYKDQSIEFRTINFYQYLHFTFTQFNLGETAVLKIYEITGKGQKILIGEYSGTNMPEKISAQALVFEYDAPKDSNINIPGWIAKFETKKYKIQNNSTRDPASDCPGAIPLCSDNNAIALAGQYTDIGTIHDETGSCISGTGTGGSVWYSFSPQTAGDIGFDLIPNNSDDYDYVLYDATNGCGDLTEMSCNYSMYTDPTGMSFNSSDYQDSYDTWWYTDCNNGWDYTYYSADASCGTWNEPEYVDPTHTYVLMINFYSGSNGGFDLNFTGVQITDNTAPTITGTSQPSCNGSLVTVDFSEQIDCTTIDNSDFSISGYTVTVANNNCVNGLTSTIDLNVVPVLPDGNYTINIQDLFDICGNELVDNYNINIATSPVSSNATGIDFCEGSSTTLDANGSGSGTLTYNWSNGASTEITSVSSSGTYTVSVSDVCGTTSTSSITVNEIPNPDIGGVSVNCNNSGADADLIPGSTTGTLTWYEWGTVATTTPITNEAECIACPTASPSYFFGIYLGCSQANCASTGPGWVSIGTGATINESSSYATSYMVIDDGGGTGCTDQAIFTIDCSTLPIKLLNFNAKANNRVIDINWSTAAEINNDYFVIEKSIDGINFNQVDIVKGNGNSNQILHYFTVDLHPYKGISYYRLKQVDFDGKFSYSKIISITNDSNSRDIEIFANSQTGQIDITGTNIQEIKVIDISGKITYEKKLNNISSDIQNFSIQTNQKQGIYFILVVSKKDIKREKVIFLQN